MYPVGVLITITAPKIENWWATLSFCIVFQGQVTPPYQTSIGRFKNF